MSYRIFDKNEKIVIMESYSLKDIMNNKSNFYRERKLQVQYKNNMVKNHPLRCLGCLENLEKRSPSQCKCCCKCGDYKCRPYKKNNNEWKNI